MLLKSTKKASARRQIDIKGVRDGVLLLRNEYRVVLEASSVNFELMSEAEQDALIETYESFLNSLPSPIQILVRTRELDMDKYLADQKARLEREEEKVYQDQIKNYADFIRGLVSNNKILTRHFYVVVPYASKGEDDFEVAKEQLSIRADIVAKGLMRMGMHSRKLSSLEILELFHSFYNPAQAKAQPIKEQVAHLLNSSFIRGER
jgi:hypothetical protein